MNPARRILQSGRRFGRWTVLQFADAVNGRSYHRCICQCGTVRTVLTQGLVSGGSRSCGCLHKEIVQEAAKKRFQRHGMCKTTEYRIWAKMIQRCTVPTAAHYDRYGGRGISVCDRWRTDFAQFYSDMGPRPSPKHSIERIDNDGDYEPSNCTWILISRQGRNTCRTRWVTVFRERMCLKDAVERYAVVSYACVRRRIDEMGWDIEKALLHRSMLGKSAA